MQFYFAYTYVIAWPEDMCIFIFTRHCQIVLLDSFARFYSVAMRVPISPHLLQNLLLLDFHILDNLMV